jgi:hypothetical protein
MISGERVQLSIDHVLVQFSLVGILLGLVGLVVGAWEPYAKLQEGILLLMAIAINLAPFLLETWYRPESGVKAHKMQRFSPMFMGF